MTEGVKQRQYFYFPMFENTVELLKYRKRHFRSKFLESIHGDPNTYVKLIERDHEYQSMA